LANNSPQLKQLREYQEMANYSQQSKKTALLQDMANNHSLKGEIIQRYLEINGEQIFDENNIEAFNKKFPKDA
jgi:hypothetical protein